MVPISGMKIAGLQVNKQQNHENNCNNHNDLPDERRIMDVTAEGICTNSWDHIPDVL